MQLVPPKTAVGALKLCSREVVIALGNWGMKITELEVHVHLIEWTDEILHQELIEDEVLGPPLVKSTISRFWTGLLGSPILPTGGAFLDGRTNETQATAEASATT